MNGIIFPSALVPVLSGELHREPTEDHNLYQFVMELINFGAKRGETVRVNGPLWMDEVVDPETDRQVASLGDKVSANPAQTLDMNYQEIALRENLLPNALQVREYEKAHSMIEVAQLNGAALAVDYFRWRDKKIRNKFLASTYKTYGGDATGLADLVAADVYNINVFNRAKVALSKRNIPRFPNNRYFCIITPAIEAKLLENQVYLDATTRAKGSAADIFKGWVADFLGITFIVNNNIPTVTANSGGSAFQADQAIMFGSGTYGLMPMGSADQLISKEKIAFYGGEASPVSNGPIVCVSGMPVQARLNDNTDYQRYQEMIWISHEEFSVLDPNPGSGKVVGRDSRFVENIVASALLS